MKESVMKPGIILPVAFIGAAALSAMVYAQVAQIRQLSNQKAPAQANVSQLEAETLESEAKSGLEVDHKSSQSGNGEVNESSTTLNVSEDGDNVTVTNRNRQSASSGNAESDSGSATSGSKSNSSNSQTTVNGKQ